MAGPALQTVFDGTAAAPGLEWFSLFGLVPLGIWGGLRFWRGGRPTIMLAVIGLAVLVVPNAIRVWDQLRIRAMAASGEGLHVTRGTIDRHWTISRRERDFSGSNGSSLRYKTITSEGFDIGAERFSWNRHSGFSPATMTNLLALPRQPIDGQEAEVTWFADPASGDERRIIRLRLGPPPWDQPPPR